MKITESTDTINLSGHWLAEMPPTLRKLACSEGVKTDGVNHRRSILTYPIASGEMYYAVVNEQTVYLQGDPEAGLSLYGQTLNGGDASSVNLAEVLPAILNVAKSRNGTICQRG